MLSDALRNGQRIPGTVLTVVRGGYEPTKFSIVVEDSAHGYGTDELLCRCVCGAELLVPVQLATSREASRRYGSCIHERRGCFTDTGKRVGGEVVAVCVCGAEERFEPDEWKRVNRAVRCWHSGEYSVPVGYRLLDGERGNGLVLLECRTCGHWFKVAERDLALRSLEELEHECVERQGCYEYVRDAEDRQVEVACLGCGRHDYFDREQWRTGAVGRAFHDCPHGVLGEREGVLKVEDLRGLDKYRCRCVECNAIVNVLREEWHYSGGAVIRRKYAKCEH